MAIPNPRQFFEQHVQPNWLDWASSLTDIRLCKNAVGDANVMAERMYAWLKSNGSLPPGVITVADYRNHLAANECGDFATIRDVAEAHKHLELNRPNRTLSRADQTSHTRIGGSWEAAWGDSWGNAWGGHQAIVTTLDDGTHVVVADVMGRVMKMWERLLTAEGI